MNKTLFILLTSFVLFYCYAFRTTAPVMTRKAPDILENRGNGPLRAYVLGDKKKLNRSLKWAHKILNLQHLFTPSGLHLSSILLFIWPLLKRLPTRFFSIALFTLAFFLPGFWAIKRICLLRILKLLFSEISWFYIFLISFVLDFFWGTFDQSPLSFCFSFLFLGLIFSLKDKRNLPLVLFSGQILIAFFWQGLVNPGAIFLGQLISLIFSFLFPIFFLGFCFPYKIFLFPLDIFTEIILVSAKLVKNLPSFYVTIDILILFLIINSKIKSKYYCIIFFVCLYPPNLFNLAPKYFQKKRRYDFYLVEERKNIDGIKVTRRGYKISYKNGYTCSYKLFNTFWQKSCF